MTVAASWQDDPIVVSGVSAVTPVGHSAAVSYTSVRAGLSRLGESRELRVRDHRGKLMNLNCAAVTGITDGQRRCLRVYRMAVRAFAEAVLHARLDAPGMDASQLFLALSEPKRPGMDDERMQSQLARKIGDTLGLADLAARSASTLSGHAGVFIALQAATRSLAEGRCTHAIVGAADTYLDELTLQWLQDTGRLKTADNPKGFVPGEGAAFLVLESLSSATARRSGTYARLAGLGNAVEQNSVYDKAPCTGTGLSAALRAALAAAHGEAAVPLSLTVCDLNGERYRAHEWGLALARGFGTGASPHLWHPADCLGDCGAAAGALNLVFATLALARRNVPDGPALVWGSSDDHERGAALLAPVASH